jgi:uncharacterized protein (TIGR03435 family)
MCVIRVLLITFVAASNLLFAQAPPNASFETASVKPSKSGGINSHFNAAGEQFTATNVRLSRLIELAYQLQIDDERLMGLPEWAQTAKYTVIAKASAGTRLTLPNFVPDGGEPSTVALMVRGLLADRFRLRMHTETRATPAPAYALVMARRDRKLGRNLINCSMLPDPSKCGIRSPSVRLFGEGVPMGRLGNLLSMMVQRPVVDRTELEGSYDITLDYVLDQPVGQPFAAPPPSASTPDGPSLFTALEEQLGLKLEPTKAAVDVFVVDSIAQPEPD